MLNKREVEMQERRALELFRKMEALSKAQQGKTVKEISQEMKVPSSVIRRLLNFGR